MQPSPSQNLALRVLTRRGGALRAAKRVPRGEHGRTHGLHAGDHTITDADKLQGCVALLPSFGETAIPPGRPSAAVRCSAARERTPHRVYGNKDGPGAWAAVTAEGDLPTGTGAPRFSGS